jgi:hypothetical protein
MNPLKRINILRLVYLVLSGISKQRKRKSELQTLFEERNFFGVVKHFGIQCVSWFWTSLTWLKLDLGSSQLSLLPLAASKNGPQFKHLALLV